MSNVSKRILARRAAVQILYQSEITGVPADKLVDEGLVPEEAKANEYARELVCGVSAHRAELDRAIGESSQNWAIDRMPVVDRSVLRRAVYAMRDVDDVPQGRGDDMPLDAALDLYDEAVKLGMKATELLETLDASDSDAPSSEGAMQR